MGSPGKERMVWIPPVVDHCWSLETDRTDVGSWRGGKFRRRFLPRHKGFAFKQAPRKKCQVYATLPEGLTVASWLLIFSLGYECGLLKPQTKQINQQNWVRPFDASHLVASDFDSSLASQWRSWGVVNVFETIQLWLQSLCLSKHRGLRKREIQIYLYVVQERHLFFLLTTFKWSPTGWQKI